MPGSRTLKAEYTFRLSENRVLDIFGSMGEEVTGGCRTLYTTGLDRMYYSPNTAKLIKSVK
jgi:hypothetical protein